MSALSLSQISLRTLCLLGERPTTERHLKIVLRYIHAHITRLEETVQRLVFSIHLGLSISESYH